MNLLALPPPIAESLRASGWRVLVTGASGWLGQAALEMLAEAFGDGWRGRVLAFGSSARIWTLRDGAKVDQHPLAEMPSLPPAPSLLLHFAYLTREKTAAMPVDAYVAANRMLSRVAAEGGASAGVERAFVVSSGAALSALAKPGDPDPALLYGRLKLEDEALFEDFAHAVQGRRVFVARLFNLSGPYINKLDSYALSSFIQQARRGSIGIRARHPVVRSYTSAANLLSVALGQLLAVDAEPHLCVETAGEREVELGELADLVRTLVAPDAAIERPDARAGPVDRYVGDGARFRRLLAAHGVDEDPLARQVVDTADYLAGIGSAGA